MEDLGTTLSDMKRALLLVSQHNSGVSENSSFAGQVETRPLHDVEGVTISSPACFNAGPYCLSLK